MRVKYDSDVIKLITLFESMTGAKVKDLIQGDRLTFVMEENEMGKAIGKNGANIKKMEFQLKKKIRLVEFNGDIAQFIRNFIHPLEVADVKEENGIVTINGKDISTRAMIIGRERQNLSNMLDVVKRYFDVKEIKVV